MKGQQGCMFAQTGDGARAPTLACLCVCACVCKGMLCVSVCELKGVNWPVKMHIFVMINPSPNRTEA